ncbi:MAG: diacylglycerol kinase family protein [Microlunatus sp.]
MPSAAIIVNPTKLVREPDARRLIDEMATRSGWDPPTWIETTQDDPGRSMAARAAEDGYDLIVAAGGDGTIRGVAGGLLGSGSRFGILPLGTGNLLARNLDIPLDLAGAVEVALRGIDRAIDVGEVIFDDRPAEPFLVITGAGLDADIMANTNDNLKKLIGWGAYVEAGGRASLRVGFTAAMTSGGQLEEPQQRHIRSYLVCNCGVLTAGITLVPQAKIDDGLLDIVTLAPYGAAGLMALGFVVATGTPLSDRLMSHTASPQSDASFHRPVEAQIDGDAVGRVSRIRTRVLPAALTVRVPESPSLATAD